MAKLTLHGGVNEIGGNCIEVDTGHSHAFLDFGIPFKRYGAAFDEFLTPRRVAGIGDWLWAGVAPQLDGVYREDYLEQAGIKPAPRKETHVVISHPHLDHMGLIPFLHSDAVIHGSHTAKSIAQSIQDTGGSFGEEDYVSITKKYQFRENAKGGLSKSSKRFEEASPRNWQTTSKQDLGPDLDLELVAVDHSIHGSCGAILSGETSIAYSGDLRCHGRHKEETERWAERAGNCDVLLIEGTQVRQEGSGVHVHEDHRLLDDFQSIPEPTEQGVEDFLTEALADESGYAFAAYPPRDLDRLESMLNAARRSNRKLCISTKQAYLLNLMHQEMGTAIDHPIPSLTDPNLRIYIPRKGWGLIEATDQRHELAASEYQTWERGFLEDAAAVTRGDIQEDPGAYIVPADTWNLTEIHEHKPTGGLYLHSKTEPFSEDMVLDRQRLLYWLDRWNLKPVAAHVSGHAPLAHLDWLIDEVDAKTVIPIHTEATKQYADHVGSKAIVTTPGQTITI